MTNPLRTGLITTLREMGADIEALERAQRRRRGDVADLRIRGSALRGVEVPAERAPSMIDEYPILAVAAASPRAPPGCAGSRNCASRNPTGSPPSPPVCGSNGVEVEIDGDDLIVHGRGRRAGGGLVMTHMDHRIAMALLMMGLASEKPVGVDDAAFIATSFPGFAATMRGLGADLS